MSTKTITCSSIFTHHRRHFQKLAKECRNEPPDFSGLDWARVCKLHTRRESALRKLLSRHFYKGGSVIENADETPRTPGVSPDSLHSPESLARLIARRSFGFGMPVTLLPLK